VCGIIGFESNRVTEYHLDKLRKVMLESEIRGKHASGIAWYVDGKLDYLTSEKSISDISNLPLLTTDLLNKDVKLIAHARYITSGGLHQPIVKFNMAVVFNGVVTQEPVSNWSYNCPSENDAELIIHSLKKGNCPFIEFPTMTGAYLVLRNGKLEYARNGYRPLWKSTMKGGLIIASTKAILNRARLKAKKVEITHGTEYQPAFISNVL